MKKNPLFLLQKAPMQDTRHMIMCLHGQKQMVPPISLSSWTQNGNAVALLQSLLNGSCAAYVQQGE